MSIGLNIKPILDEAAAKRAADLATRLFGNAGQGAASQFGQHFSGGLQSAQSDVRKLANELSRMYDKSANSAGKLKIEEEKLADLRTRGVTGHRLTAQIERTLAAQRAEARNVRDTTEAYRQLRAAQNQKQSTSFGRFGRDAASTFTSSFSDGLKGGAIATALIGAVKGGFATIEQLASTAAHTIASAFQESLKTGIDFQRIQNEFQGVAQASTAEVAQMKAKAMELGSDVTLPGVSTKQAAEAMTQLVKDGFSVQEAIKGVRGVLELATAGQIEAADAAEILGDSINMFQLHASDATRVADIFAATVNASSVSMRDMQLAMSMGGNMAHGFGMSIEQTAAAIGALGKMGIKGSDAGTLMKTMLKQLVSPSEEVTGALNELGVTVADSQGNFVGFESILGQLSRAAKSMSQMQFDQLASTAFGSDAIRGAIFAAKDGERTYREMLGSVTRLGAAHQMAAAQMQGWPGVIEGIKNSVEGMKLSVFSAFDSIAKGYGPGLVGVFDKIGNWFSTHQPEIIQGFTVIGLTALEVGKSFVTAGQLAMAGLNPIVKGITAVVDTIFRVTGNLASVLGSAISKLPDSMKKMFGLEGAAKDLQEFSASMSRGRSEIQGMAQSWDQMRGGLASADRQLQGWITNLASAGNQAKQAAEFTRAVGKAHAEMRGMDIIIKDNTPEVEANLRALGLKVEHLPHGEVKVTADTAAGQQMLDSFRRGVTNTPVNMPIRPVLTDAADFQSKMLSWINAIREGKDPGQLPQFQPNDSPGGIGGFSHWGAKGAAPPAGPALPDWATPIPKKPKKGDGGGGGSHGSSYDDDDDGGHVGSDAHLTAETKGVKHFIESMFPQVTDIGGWRANDPYPDHPSGQAIDVMIPKNLVGTAEGKALGDAIVRAAFQDPSVDYVLWQQRQWNRDGSSSPMGDRGSPTENHMDHAHVHTQKGFGNSYSSDKRGATPVSVQNFGSSAKSDIAQMTDQIGTNLPDAFGLSEGLPGIAKWITGFLANLAFAPAIGALSAVKNVSNAQAQAAGLPTGGGGLFGMLAGGFSGAAGGLPGAVAQQAYGGAGGGAPTTYGQGGATPYGASPSYAPGAAPGSPGVKDIHAYSAGGVPGPGQPGFGAPGAPDPSQTPGGSILPGAPGAAIGPAGLKTPAPVGRQIGKDVPASSGMSFGGGILGAAAGAAGAGANMMAPGAGAGAQIGMDMMNRTAGYIAQLGGIAASGLLETFALSDTGLADPTNTVLGRIAMGIAGARPQLPNIAGQSGGQGGKGVAGNTQGDVHGMGDLPPGQGGQGERPWLNIENFHNGSGNAADGQSAGRDVARQFKTADASRGAQGGRAG